MKKPIIGITLDEENSGYYSKFPWYAIRKNYLHTIEKIGGFPLPLLHSLENIENITQNIFDNTFEMLKHGSNWLTKEHLSKGLI